VGDGDQEVGGDPPGGQSNAPTNSASQPPNSALGADAVTMPPIATLSPFSTLDTMHGTWLERPLGIITKYNLGPAFNKLLGLLCDLKAAHK
jgi:hypothetical protein